MNRKNTNRWTNYKRNMAFMLAAMLLGQGISTVSVMADDGSVSSSAKIEASVISSEEDEAYYSASAQNDGSDQDGSGTTDQGTSGQEDSGSSEGSSEDQGGGSSETATDLKDKMPLTLKTDQVKAEVTEGTSLGVTLKVTNKSRKEITGLTFEIDSCLSNLSVDDLEDIMIDSIKAGETKTVTIPVSVDTSLSSGTTSTSLIVRCNYTSDGQKYTGKKKAGLTLVNTAASSDDSKDDSGSSGSSSDDESYSYDYSGVYTATDYSYSSDEGTYTTAAASTVASKTPTLLVKSYSTGGTVKTGSSFSFKMEFMNTSNALTIENATITMEPSDGVTLQDSSNVIYIDSLAAGQTSEQTITLKALADAKDENQKMALSISYEYVDNGERKTAQSTVNLSFPVEQADRMEFRDATYDDEMQAEKEGSISIPVVNKGRGDVYNLEATLELENADIEQATIYAGNYESGKSGTIDFIVTPEQAGEYTGTVHITYENKDEETKTVDVPISFTASEAAELTDIDYSEYMDESESESTGIGGKIAIGGGIAVAIAAAGVVVRIRRKKSRKGRDGMDDDLDGWDSEE